MIVRKYSSLIFGGFFIFSIISSLFLLAPPEEPISLASGAKTVEKKVSEVRQLGSISSYGEISERPLFIPGRRRILPVVEPAIVVNVPPLVVPAIAPLQAELIGVVVAPEVTAAIVRIQGGKFVTVNKGSSIDGWVLTEVNAGKVLFISGEQTLELAFPMHSRVFDANKTVAAASAAPIPLRRRR